MSDFIHRVEVGASGIFESVGSALGSALKASGTYIHDLGVKLQPIEAQVLAGIEVEVVKDISVELPKLEAAVVAELAKDAPVIESIVEGAAIRAVASVL